MISRKYYNLTCIGSHLDPITNGFIQDWQCPFCLTTISLPDLESAEFVGSSVCRVCAARRIPDIINDDELARLVRDSWAMACHDHMETPPPAWVKPYDELSQTMKDIELSQGRRIITAYQGMLEACGILDLIQQCLTLWGKDPNTLSRESLQGLVDAAMKLQVENLTASQLIREQK